MKALIMIAWALAFSIVALLFVWLGATFAQRPTEFQIKKLYHCNCIHPRDYQIDLHMDTVWVYDGDRLVGRYTSNWHNQIDSILIKDNQ